SRSGRFWKHITSDYGNLDLVSGCFVQRTKKLRAAEQRSELSPGRGFASPGCTSEACYGLRSSDRVRLQNTILFNHIAHGTVSQSGSPIDKYHWGMTLFAAPRLRKFLCTLTQGSQSLALGLALLRCSAAQTLPQKVP